MVVVFLLFTILILIIISFIVKLVNLLKENNYEKTLSFLHKFSVFFLVLLFLTYIISLIVIITNLNTYDYMFILLIEIVFRFYFFYLIYIESKTLFENLHHEAIFISQNVKSIKKIALSFLYLALIEIIGGLAIALLSILVNPSSFNFTLETNFIVVLFIIVGLIMLITSMILEKAIEIYEENKLTI